MLTQERRTFAGRLPAATVAVVAGLMVATAVLFWTASAIEKRGARERPLSKGAPAAISEGSPEREREERASAESTGLTEPAEQRLLGIDLEAQWVPYAVIAETVVLALALILFGYPVLFFAIVVSVAGLILDVGELIHQVGASRAGLATLVGAVALSRVVTAAVSVGAVLPRKRTGETRA